MVYRPTPTDVSKCYFVSSNGYENVKSNAHTDLNRKFRPVFDSDLVTTMNIGMVVEKCWT